MVRGFMVFIAFACSPFVLWVACANAQDVVIDGSMMGVTIDDTIASLESPIQLTGSPISFTYAEPVSTEPSTWGHLKVGMRNDDVVGLPQPSRSAIFSVAFPFHENPSDWYEWSAERTDYWTHHGADYYAVDLSRSGCTGVPVYAGISGRVFFRQGSSGYGNTVVIYDAARHVAVRYAHLQDFLQFCGVVYVNTGDWIGTVGSTGRVTGPHLHIVAYENINDNGGNPIIPTSGDSEFYCSRMAFYCR